MLTRRAPAGACLALVALCVLAATGCGSDTSTAESRAIIEFPDAAPGDVIALRASDSEPRTVELVDRRAGTIRSVDIDTARIATLATVDVSTTGTQRGLLGHTVIDGIRYAAWTDPGNDHLLVGALTTPLDGTPATVDRIAWDAGGTDDGAVGGHLAASAGGQLILGIGQLTDWARSHGSGAMLQLDPLGPADQVPIVLSNGYTNPFAFAVTNGLDEPLSNGQLWVADNAVGDDVERIGRADPGSEFADRDNHPSTDAAPRAPSAVVALPDGRLAVCGFLDGRLQAWQPSQLLPPSNADTSDSTGDARTLEPGADLGPCLTGAARLADGTIVTATADALLAF